MSKVNFSSMPAETTPVIKNPPPAAAKRAPRRVPFQVLYGYTPGAIRQAGAEEPFEVLYSFIPRACSKAA